MPPLPDRNPAGSGFIARLADFPQEIGPFRILRQIGSGGMGIVFLAQQDKPSRTVALKVVHGSVLSQNTLRRFEQEAEVLARLQHPGIAQVFQVGTYATRAGELPYIAMEFVEGERLDHWTEKRKPPIRARLELAAKIADAVEHAHQKGVIHRDLKPGNILVTADGQPKILDFGVARLAAGEDSRTTTLRTDMGALLGTLSYMSPEQASGDPKAVDLRADVYSLGVVIYEMLAARLPYFIERVALPEAVRVIREEEPTKLSKFDRALRGDVETIVGKALEKDRTRRYASAQELADDIRRSLADEPIHARPPSAFYQLSKFAQRNQVLVGAIAAVFVSLAVGVGVATWLYVKEREASQRERTALVKEREAGAREREALAQAKLEGQRASTTANFLISLFSGINPNFARGEDTKLLQRILSEARARLTTELTGQPEVEAQVREVLGTAYKFMSLFPEAEAELTRANAIWAERHGLDDRRALHTSQMLASVAVRKAEYERAEKLLLDTAERQLRAFGPSDRDTLSTRSSIGDLYMRQGRFKEAEETLRAVLAQQVQAFGDVDEDVLSTKFCLCSTLSFESKSEEALELIEGVWRVRREKYGDDAPDTILSLSARASALRDVGRLDEAIADQRRALAAALRIYGPDNQQSISMENNLAIALQMVDELDEAEDLLRDVLDRRTRIFGKDHSDTLNTLTNLVGLLRKQGRVEEYGPLTMDVLERTRRALGEDHFETARAYSNAGTLLGGQGKFAEAAKMFAAVAANDRKRLREDDPDRSLSLYNWAACLQNAGDDEAAEPVLREMLGLVDAHGLGGERFVPAARNALAKVLEKRGAHDEADLLFKAALEERRRRFPKPDVELAYSLSDYGEALVERGDARTALPLIDELVELRGKLRDDPPWTLPWTHSLHARCLTKLGRFADAEAEIVPACEALLAMEDAKPAAVKEARAAILELYAAWEVADPGKGIGARADFWK